MQAYLKSLQNDNQFKITDGDRIAEEVFKMTLRGVTYENGTYYLLFHEVKGKEFTGTTDAFPELKWAKENQKVNVSYTNTEAKVISLNNFDIIGFEI